MKSTALWIAGNGFTAMQIFIYLQQTWSKTIFVILSCLVFWIFTKLPKELHLIFWIIISVITTVLYYMVKPENGKIF